MTRAELVTAIMCRLGLVLAEREVREDRATLVALSAHGTELFTVEIARTDDGGWRFAGCGELLAKDWTALCALGRPADDRPDTCGRCAGTGSDLPPAPGALCTGCDGTGEQ